MKDDRPVTQGDITRWLGWASAILLGCLLVAWLLTLP